MPTGCLHPKSNRHCRLTNILYTSFIFECFFLSLTHRMKIRRNRKDKRIFLQIKESDTNFHHKFQASIVLTSLICFLIDDPYLKSNRRNQPWRLPFQPQSAQQKSFIFHHFKLAQQVSANFSVFFTLRCGHRFFFQKDYFWTYRQSQRGSVWNSYLWK